jgi:hypothetical protein
MNGSGDGLKGSETHQAGKLLHESDFPIEIKKV